MDPFVQMTSCRSDKRSRTSNRLHVSAPVFAGDHVLEIARAGANGLRGSGALVRPPDAGTQSKHSLKPNVCSACRRERRKKLFIPMWQHFVFQGLGTGGALVSSHRPNGREAAASNH